MAKDSGFFWRAPLIIGAAIGTTWVALAAAAIWSATRGALNGRPDWALAWGLVGGLLLAAGIAALFGSWWHVTRIESHD